MARLAWGLFMYALGVVMTVHANLGASPWDVFHQGLSLRLGITFGTASVAVGVVIVAFAALAGERVGFGTLCNMVAVGMFADLLMLNGWIPEMSSFVSGLCLMIAGLFVIAIASFFYIGAGYGAGPRDSLMVVMARRTGRPVGLCRAAVETVALFCGWLLGGRTGIGTLIAAFGIGVAVQVVFTALRFNVRMVPQESFCEFCARLKSMSKSAKPPDVRP
jgi:uncharacterized membrane protein YczE